MERPQRPANNLYTVIKETDWVSLKFCTEDGQNLDKKMPKTKKKQQLGVGWVGFFESKCMKRRRLKSMSQNGFWNIKICKYSGKTQTKQVR